MIKRVFLYLLATIMVATLNISFTSCSDDDDEVSRKSEDLATQVASEYVGTLKPMGYSDAPARCYVSLSRLSNDAVRMTNLICEEFGMDMNPVNLTVKRESDGRIYLQSETSKSVEGTYYQGQLTLTFSTSVATFYFSGVKN